MGSRFTWFGVVSRQTLVRWRKASGATHEVGLDSVEWKIEPVATLAGCRFSRYSQPDTSVRDKITSDFRQASLADASG